MAQYAPHPDLVDAQKMHKQYPATFWAPSARELQKVKVGDFAKITIEGERFWVEVVKINRIGRTYIYTGRIRNRLWLPNLKYDDTICFQRKHIYDVLPPQK